jgi:hypothetical protein
MRDASVTGTSKVEGSETYELSGNIDSAALADALGGVQPGRNVEVELWIGTEDSLPRRARIEGPLSDAEASAIVREIELSKFNQKVEIEPPP